MDQNQRELRRAAAKAFQESLDQLGQSFQPGQVKADETHSAAPATQHPPVVQHPPAKEPAIEPETPDPGALDFEALEAAAADIEQFMQSKEQE